MVPQHDVRRHQERGGEQGETSERRAGAPVGHSGLCLILVQIPGFGRPHGCHQPAHRVHTRLPGAAGDDPSRAVDPVGPNDFDDHLPVRELTVCHLFQGNVVRGEVASGWRQAAQPPDSEGNAVPRPSIGFQILVQPGDQIPPHARLGIQQRTLDFFQCRQRLKGLGDPARGLTLSDGVAPGDARRESGEQPRGEKPREKPAFDGGRHSSRLSLVAI